VKLRNEIKQAAETVAGRNLFPVSSQSEPKLTVLWWPENNVNVIQQQKLHTAGKYMIRRVGNPREKANSQLSMKSGQVNFIFDSNAVMKNNTDSRLTERLIFTGRTKIIMPQFHPNLS